MIGLRRLGGAHRDAGGQSLVEVALMLPILLLIVLGTVDVGRIFALKAAVTNAAREAAIHAARDPQAPMTAICQRARDELGAGTNPNPCSAAPIIVSCLRGGKPCDSGIVPGDTYDYLYRPGGGSDIEVTVHHTVSLLSTYLIGRAFPSDPIVSATASAPGLSP